MIKVYNTVTLECTCFELLSELRTLGLDSAAIRKVASKKVSSHGIYNIVNYKIA